MCDVNCHARPSSRINIRDYFCKFITSQAHRNTVGISTPPVLARSHLFYLNISPPVAFRVQQWRASFSRFLVFAFFFHGLPLRSRSCVLSRCNHPLSLSLAHANAFQQPLAVLPLFYDGRYSTLLPSSDDYLCLRAKREMKAKLFDSALRADFPLSLSLFPFGFFSFISLTLFLSTPPFLVISPSVSLYSLYPSPSLLFPLSLFLSHPFATFASPISLSGLHACASFPSYRPAAAILLPPF